MKKFLQLKKNSLKRIKDVRVFGNNESYDNKEKLSKLYKETLNEDEFQTLRREYGVGGLYSPYVDNIWLNKNSKATGTHELTHATSLDTILRALVPTSQATLNANENIKKKYKNKDNPFLGTDFSGDYKIVNNKKKWIGHEQEILKNPEETKKELYDQGIDVEDLRYLDRTDEIYPRIMSIRKRNNISPDDVITDEKMEEIYENNPDDIFKIYTKEQVKKMLNKFADNKTHILQDKNKSTNFTKTNWLEKYTS